jgi:hypothetical protein
MSKKYAKRFTLGARTNGLGFVAAAKLATATAIGAITSLTMNFPIYLLVVRLSEDSVGP